MAKSPVHGLGRNRKRNRGPFHASAANTNMRGKKHRMMSCGCCECIDLREKIGRKIADQEINDARSSNGRTPYSDYGNLGSNPRRASRIT